MVKNSKTYQPLDEVIEKSGIKYKVIAERMGVSYDSLRNWRIEPNKLTLERIQELEQVIGAEQGTIYKVMKNFTY